LAEAAISISYISTYSNSSSAYSRLVASIGGGKPHNCVN
jgi:hypothetical protein